MSAPPSVANDSCARRFRSIVDRRFRSFRRRALLSSPTGCILTPGTFVLSSAAKAGVRPKNRATAVHVRRRFISISLGSFEDWKKSGARAGTLPIEVDEGFTARTAMNFKRITEANVSVHRDEPAGTPSAPSHLCQMTSAPRDDLLVRNLILLEPLTRSRDSPALRDRVFMRSPVKQPAPNPKNEGNL